MPLPKILIVDDESYILKLLEFNFQEEGFMPLCAANGPQAIEIARRETPSLILLDIAMPEMDGFQVLKELKSDARTRNIPVVMLTVRVYEEDERESYSLGAVEYITKPFSPLQVVQRVKEILRIS